MGRSSRLKRERRLLVGPGVGAASGPIATKSRARKSVSVHLDSRPDPSVLKVWLDQIAEATAAIRSRKESRDQLIVRALAMGASQSAIGKALGVTRQAVAEKYVRSGKGSN